MASQTDNLVSNSWLIGASMSEPHTSEVSCDRPCVVNKDYKTSTLQMLSLCGHKIAYATINDEWHRLLCSLYGHSLLASTSFSAGAYIAWNNVTC